MCKCSPFFWYILRGKKSFQDNQSPWSISHSETEMELRGYHSLAERPKHALFTLTAIFSRDGNLDWPGQTASAAVHGLTEYLSVADKILNERPQRFSGQQHNLAGTAAE